MAITYELVAADWEVDNITGRIEYVGDDHNGTSPSYATVIELHRWMDGLADDQAPADVSDKMYIAIPKASSRSTDNIITLINGFYITSVEAEHLYDGSILQNGGDDIWDGIVNFGNLNVQIQIIQDGAKIIDDFWNYNYGGAATGGSGTTLVDSGDPFVGELADLVGYSIVNETDDARGIVSVATSASVVTLPSGELYGTGNLDFVAVDDYLIGVPLNQDSAQGISHRFLIKVRENGADIDGRRLIGICRRPGRTFSWFPINGTSRGNNVLALSDSSDLNYDTANQTVMGAGWDGEFSGEDAGFSQQDVDNNLTDEDYFGLLTWGGSHDINDLYMRAMGETCDFGGYTVHGLDGEVLRGVTHSCGYDGPQGGISVSDYDMLVWGTLILHDVPAGAFTVGEVIVNADPASADIPTFYATILAIDDTLDDMIVNIDSGVLGNSETFWGVSSGADADTTADPAELSGGGVLHVLANDTGNDIIYVQVLKGTMPADNEPLYYGGTDLSSMDVSDYFLVANDVDPITEFALSKTTPYIGVSTGTALLGAHGVGIDKGKLQDSDSVLPLGESTPISPPLTVTNTYSGLDTTNDQILVAPTDGTTVDINGDPPVGAAYFKIEVALTGAGQTVVTVQEELSTGNIDDWLPASGYISIVNDEGLVVNHPYSAYDTGGDTFTITSHDFNGSGVDDSVSVGNYAFVYQMHLVTSDLTGGAEDTVEVNAIVGSTPDDGTIRIVNDDGFHIRHPYSVYSDGDDEFTITAADFSGDGLTEQASIGAGVYVSYIDKKAASASETFVAVYDNDLNLTVVVRDGDGTPIKEDKKRHTFTNSNATHGVTRTSDT